MKVGEKDLRAGYSYHYIPAETHQPGLVVEVAWSQSTKKLRKKAKEFSGKW